MSKLYKKYVLLKINNPKKIYLFECGIFYIFIHEDAELMSSVLNLKLTYLNSDIVKCGFPIKSANKYLNILKTLNYDIDIVPADEHSSPTNVNSYIMAQNFHDTIKDFLKINVNSLSISQAFDLLNDLQNKLKEMEEEQDKNAEKNKI